MLKSVYNKSSTDKPSFKIAGSVRFIIFGLVVLLHLGCEVPIYISNWKMELKEIDGSVLEGGGQILRLSIAFSCLFEQHVKIFKIRAGRSSPGLKPQHLAGIQLVKQMCNATVTGDKQNSCELIFNPKTLKMGNFNLNINPQTAASIPLMIQSVLPVAIFAKHNSTIIMKGGTDVSFAPSMDYVTNVLFPIIKKMGISCSAQINKRGFYPKGRGEVILKIDPINGPLNPIVIDNFGDQPTIRGIVFLSGPRHLNNKHQIVSDIESAVKNKLNNFGYHKVDVETKIEESDGSGGSLVLTALSGKCLLGTSALYDMRKSTVQSISNEACNKLVNELDSKSCVDANAVDNLIIFMALANGKSKVKCKEITLHTETAIHIAKQFTNAKFEITQTEDGLKEIVCEGIGFKPT
ncbi:RNA 3'-terminal phosphate cyclase [Adelges cooleyi]|uniref:RNA 3'-terminal phosphate cyclase n=1 Tax=Adelges cooleyi TaxID=133065 RepID=UPI00217FB886|nr:RNA 3'-terminal phosphate cyclase [Adelges cooleyi]